MDYLEKKKEFLQLTQADTLVVKDVNSFLPDEYVSFPLGELSSLGALFSSLPAAFSSLAQTNNSGKVLYLATFPVAGKLAAAKDGSGLLGTIVNENGVAGQARFHEVKDLAKATSGVSIMFMALAIMTINRSIKNISENQKEIISFLEIEKQTQLKGDLIILSEIIEDYQHNWNNIQYRTNREMQVLDIKRSAEQNILFYRETVEKKFAKRSFVHLDTAKELNSIQLKFRYYKLSLYLYAFASFLDILLLENFETTYLDSVVKKIKNYSLEYDAFYQKSLVSVEQYASSSLQSRILQGLAIAGEFAGKQISKIPDKDNEIKIDDKLISGSSKLNTIKAEAINRTMVSFSSVEDSGIQMFCDKISLIDKMYNEPLRITFDDEKIYIPVGTT